MSALLFKKQDVHLILRPVRRPFCIQKVQPRQALHLDAILSHLQNVRPVGIIRTLDPWNKQMDLENSPTGLKCLNGIFSARPEWQDGFIDDVF